MGVVLGALEEEEEEEAWVLVVDDDDDDDEVDPVDEAPFRPRTRSTGPTGDAN